MADTDLSPGAWLAQYGSSLPFVAEAGHLLWLERSPQAIDLPADLPSEIPLHIRAIDGGVPQLNTRGHTIGELEVVSGRVHLLGEGIVQHLVVGEPSVELSVHGRVEIQVLDASKASQLSLFAIDKPTIAEFRVGTGTVGSASESAVIGELVVVGDAGIRLPDAGIRAQRLTGPDSVEFLAGRLHTKNLDPSTIQLHPGADLNVEGAVPQPFIVNFVEGGVFSLTGQAQEVTFTGSHGRVNVSEGSLSRPHFQGAAIGWLRVENRGEVLLADGSVSLAIADGILIGSDKKGIQFRAVEVVEPDTAELENVDFFVLTPAMLSVLDRAQRVTPWWPARRIVRRRSEEWTGGLKSEGARLVARAHYWGEVERLLRDKGARGNDLVVAHEVAQNARRLAAKERTAERLLLEASRVLGYTARPIRPVALWAALAVLVAILARVFGGGLCLCNPGSGFDLWVDVLLSPVTWVRPVGEESELTAVIGASSMSELVAFVGRLFGTVALGATLLAVRRYVQPGKG